MNSDNRHVRVPPSIVCNRHCSCHIDKTSDNQSDTFYIRDLTLTTTTMTNNHPYYYCVCYHKSVCGYCCCYYYYYYCLAGCHLNCGWSTVPLCLVDSSMWTMMTTIFGNRNNNCYPSSGCHRCMGYLQSPDNASKSFVHPFALASWCAPR